MNGTRIKAVYLFLYMGFATWRVFYNVYLNEHGFSGSEIGVINALIQATMVVIVPLWGYFADKHGIRPSLRLAVFISAGLMLFLGRVLDFHWLIAYILLLTVFHHPLGPLTDALAVQLGKSDPQKYNYGNLRLWGSLGWAIASIITGYLFTHISLDWVFPITTLLFLVGITFFGNPFRKPQKIFRPRFTPISVKEIVANKPLLIFIIILFIYGIACSPVNAYLNLYFHELGADNSLIGIAYMVQSISELPFFILGTYLVKRMGARKVILISMLVMTGRMFFYGFSDHIYWAVAMGAFQGISLGFFLVGVVDYIHKQLPDGRDATAQSLIWGLYFGVGHTIGNFFTGYLKDVVQMQGVMRYFAWFVAVIFVFAAVYFAIIRRQRLAKSSEIERV